VDTAIQRYIRIAAVRGREVEQIGPFLATFNGRSASPFSSYAIPDDGAEPSPGDVAALRAAYERRERIPRLEFLPSVVPAAEAALLAGGFALEARLPLMTCAPGEAPELAAPDGIELVLAASDDELRAGMTVAHTAFGEPGEPDAHAVARTRAMLETGGIAVLARTTAEGEAVGWGVCTGPADGTTELAGIATSEGHRRRGIAGAIVARVTREAFARGVTTAFLTPGDEGAGRVYTRAGFRTHSEMLHMRVPTKTTETTDATASVT
jgi:GNAT superfamily N-acetyltransferase